MFSIIIPVYNVEKYLTRCLRSIIGQLSSCDEIILIDDGSTDSSGKICEDWGNRYDNITVVHKENGGLSDARNAGIPLAKNEYIWFIDSDDTILDNAISILRNIITALDIDIINFGFNFVDEDGKLISSSHGETVGPIDKKMAVEMILMDKDLHNYAWANVYKRSLFDELNYPKGKLYEDKFTTFRVYDKAHTIYRINLPLYNYFLRTGSICNSVSFNRKIKGALDNIEGLLTQYEFASRKNLKRGKQSLSKRINTCSVSLCRFLYKKKRTEEIEKLRALVIHDFKEKNLELSIFCYSKALYSILMFFYCLVKR